MKTSKKVMLVVMVMLLMTGAAVANGVKGFKPYMIPVDKESLPKEVKADDLEDSNLSAHRLEEIALREGKDIIVESADGNTYTGKANMVLHTKTEKVAVEKPSNEESKPSTEEVKPTETKEETHEAPAEPSVPREPEQSAPSQPSEPTQPSEPEPKEEPEVEPTPEPKEEPKPEPMPEPMPEPEVTPNPEPTPKPSEPEKVVEHTGPKEEPKEPSNEDREPAQEPEPVVTPVPEPKPEPEPEPAHEHTWEKVTETVHHEATYKTVHHEAVTEEVWVVDKEAWTEEVNEEIVEWHTQCDACGALLAEMSVTDIDQHIKAHALAGQSTSYGDRKVVVGYNTYTIEHPEEGHTETKVVKEAYDEQIIDSPAYDEEVTVGYKCSCGASK